MRAGWLVMNGSISRQSAANCHRHRNTMRTMSWVPMTQMRRSRNARRKRAWRSETAPRESSSLTAFNVEVLPDGLAVGAEFGGVARGHRGPLARNGQRDVVDVLHFRGPAAEHDHAVRHRHGLLDVVLDEQRGLAV